MSRLYKEFKINMHKITVHFLYVFLKGGRDFWRFQGWLNGWKLESPYFRNGIKEKSGIQGNN